MDEEYLRVEDVAKRLKVTRQAVYNWIADGRLKAVRVAGKTMRIPVSSLLAIMEPVNPGETLGDEEPGNLEPVLLAA